jgi:hypothetical protein
MKKIYIALLCPPFLSCVEQRYPLTSQPSQNNVTYQVDYLFEHEGCRVYRFIDHGNYIYYTNCRGEAIAKTDSTEVRNKISILSKDKQ